MSTQSPSPTQPRSFLKDAAAVFGSRIVRLGLTFVSGVLIARLLGPDGKGILAALAVYPTLIISLAELGVRQAAIYHLGKKFHDERDVIGTVMFLLLFSSLTGVLLCAGLYALIDNPNFTHLMIALVLASIPINLAITLFQGILLGKEQIGKFSVVSWASQLLRLLGILLFVWFLGWGVMGELVGSLVTGAAAAAYALWLVARHAALSFRFAPKLIKEMLSLGFTYAFALFVISLNYKVDIVILERLVLPEDIGQYTLGVNLAELLWQLPAALGVVVFSRSANAKDPAAFTRNVVKLLRVTLIVAVVGALGLGLTAGFLIPLVYGEAFRPSVGVLRLLLPGIVAFSLFKVLNVDLAGRGRPLLSLIAVGPAVLLNVALNFLLVPRYGVSGAAVASTISYTLAIVLYVWVYARAVEVSLWEMLRYRKSDFSFLSKIGAKLR